MEKHLTVTGVGAGRGEDPGPGRDRCERGYFIASARTWRRIEIEFSAGASAAWLSAKYGPRERTIAAHAKEGSWRKKDIALKADAAWDAVDEAAEARAAAREAARATDAVRGAAEAVEPEVDLGRAVLAAQAKAVAAMEDGNPRLAQEFLKLARMLERDGDGEEGCVGPSPQDQAALAYVLERLGAEE